MMNKEQSYTGRRFRTRTLVAVFGAALLIVMPLRESVAAVVLHDPWYFLGMPDSVQVDTMSTPALRVNLEALWAVFALGGGVNVDYRLLRTGSSAGIIASVRGFFSVQSIATIGIGHGSGSQTSSMIGSNLQLGAYLGNFEANIGAGIGVVGGASVAGPATDLSAELLFRFGEGPLTLTLLGRIFVKDWDRSYYYTDNALGYGGLGLRFQFR